MSSMSFSRIKRCGPGAMPGLNQVEIETRSTDDCGLLTGDGRLARSSWRLTNEIAQRRRVQRLYDRVAHLKPDWARLTAADQGAGLFRDILRYTLHRCNRTLHDSINFSHPDFVGIPGQLIAAMRAARALYESSTPQWSDQLLQIRHGDRRRPGDRRDRHRAVSVILGQGDHCADAVFAS